MVGEFPPEAALEDFSSSSEIKESHQDLLKIL